MDNVEITPELEARMREWVPVLMADPAQADWEDSRSASFDYYDADLDATITVDVTVSKLGRKPWKHAQYGCPKVCKYHPNGRPPFGW